MAERIVSTLKGKVKFETDKASLSSVKKEIKKLKEEMKGLGSPFGGMGGGSRGSRGSGENRSRQSFEKYQKRTIENFKIANAQIRDMSKSERDVHVEILKQAKTREELQMSVRKQKARIADQYREEKRITREKEKQNLIQRRITSSTEQMVGALGSAFVAVEALQGIVNTGMKFEAFEKTFLAVSESSEDAKNNMQFAREQAMRLGVDLVESGKAYSRMLGAAGSNTPVDQIRDTFVAVSEASIAMGLSADDQMGVYRAK